MLNFPDSPTAGTVFGAWRYDGTKWGAVSGVSGGGSAGDITAVLAGTGLSGGGTEGDVSIALAVPVTVARGGTGATDAATALANLGGAPLASPTFTGDPKAPTPAAADNDTSIATTAYVKAQGYQTGNQTITLSGDASGSGTTAITTTLATINANVGTFQGLTVNAKGLVTAAANQSYLTAPVNLTSQVTGTLPVANGGTGATTGNVGPYLPLVAGSGNPLTGTLHLIPPAATDAAITLTKPASGRINYLIGTTAGVNRWTLQFGDGAAESGSNAGSDWSLTAYNDGGTSLGTPFWIKRSSGGATHATYGSTAAAVNCAIAVGFVGGGTQYGICTRPVTDVTNHLAFFNAANTIVGTINVSATATAYNTTSDARLKEDLKSFDAGQIIDNTNVYDFKWRDREERAYGVMAQQAIEVYPNAVTHTEDDDWYGVDYSRYVPVLLQEVKALRERVRQLEGK